MTAGPVPTSNLTAFYTNTSGGTPASPTAIDAAMGDIVQTINDNYAYAAGLVASNKLSDMGIINVKDYGAKGDGVTDDTAAIQTAINSANTAGGGLVIIPSSSSFYRITNTITLYSSITLMGAFKNIAKTSIKLDTSDASKPVITADTASYHSIQNLYLSTVNNCQNAIYLEDCTRFHHSNIVIEGNFRYGWHHKHTGTGGYYNHIERVVVALGSSVYSDSIGYWAEGYFSASEFQRCDVTQAKTGFKIDYANAVTLDTCSIENCATIGVDVGADTFGLNIVSPYFEGNSSGKNVVVADGANFVKMDFMRTGENLEDSFTYSKNNLAVGNGLQSYNDYWGVRNLIFNNDGNHKDSAGAILKWLSASGATNAVQETTLTNGYRGALKFTNTGVADNFAYVQHSVAIKSTARNKTLTICGYYHVPAWTPNTKPTIRIYVGSTMYTQFAMNVTSDFTFFKRTFTLPDSTTATTVDVRVYSVTNGSEIPVSTEAFYLAGLTMCYGQFYSISDEAEEPTLYKRTYLDSLTYSALRKNEVRTLYGYGAISSGATSVSIDLSAFFGSSSLINYRAQQTNQFTLPIQPVISGTTLTVTITSAAVGALTFYYEVVVN